MSKAIPFVKMHGLGNDFVIINNLTNKYKLKPGFVSQLANRHFGVGFDQLLVVEKASSAADFFCRIYNADGYEAEQCGNGLRCVARYLREEGLSEKVEIALETKAGTFPVQFISEENIRVGLGVPQVEEKLLPLEINQSLTLPTTILSLGNPHAIIKVDRTEAVSSTLAADIAKSNFFPNGVNVGFMQVISPQHVRLRTFERGVGETFACGSNACAAAIAGILNGWLDYRVNVEYRYGSLMIEWDTKENTVFISGPAVTVFHGKLNLPTK